MLEEIAIKIIESLKYYKNLTYKIQGGRLKFYYYNKNFKIPYLLRSCVENNFKESNDFYVGIEKMCDYIKSDYVHFESIHKISC